MIVWGGFNGNYLNNGGRVRPGGEHLGGDVRLQVRRWDAQPHRGLDRLEDDRLGRVHGRDRITVAFTILRGTVGLR